MNCRIICNLFSTQHYKSKVLLCTLENEINFSDRIKSYYAFRKLASKTVVRHHWVIMIVMTLLQKALGTAAVEHHCVIMIVITLLQKALGIAAVGHHCFFKVIDIAI